MSSRSDDTAYYSGPIPGNGKGGLSWEDRQRIFEATGVSCSVRWRNKVQELTANGPIAGRDVAIKMAEDIILKQQATDTYSRPIASSSSSSGHVEQGGLRSHSLGTSQPSKGSQPMFVPTHSACPPVQPTGFVQPPSSFPCAQPLQQGLQMFGRKHVFRRQCSRLRSSSLSSISY